MKITLTVQEPQVQAKQQVVLTTLVNIGISAGGSGANLSVGNITSTNLTIASDTGTDAVVPAATTSAAGLATAAQITKLEGIATGATANSSDATLLNRANHTGTQAQSTITDLVTDLSNKQPLATVLTNTTASFTTALESKLGGIASGAEVNVNADWNSSSGDSQILDKPTLGTSSALDIPASGNASGSQVVKGDDTRLTDNRTPTSHTHTVGELVSIPTASLVGRYTSGTGAGETLSLGANLTASGGVLNVVGVSSSTNLTTSGNTTTVTINSDTGTDATIPAATASAAGVATAAQITKLDGIEAGANNLPLYAYSTGLVDGGLLSIGSPTTTFNLSAGVGEIVDNVTGTRTHVTWSTFSNVPATYVSNGLVSFVAIDSTGAIFQQLTPFTNTQHRQYITIGSLVHTNQTNLDATNQFGEIAINPANIVSDLNNAIGKFNISGNVFSANGANLTLNKSAGFIYAEGSNWDTNKYDPNTRALGSLTALTFQYRFQNGTNGATGTNVNPNLYDLNGVATSVPTNKFTVQRIFSFVSNNVKIQFGQSLYNSLAEAIAAIQTQSFVTEASISYNGVLRGFLVVQQGTTDLSNTTKAFFLDSPKFGGTAGVGGLSVSTLQNAYDNSVTPEITTDATRGAVSVKAGVSNGNNNYEGVNTSGAVTFAVTGNGDVTGLSYNGVALTTGGSATQYLAANGSYASIATASGSQTGLLSSTDWTTFNGKQAALSGTGFVKFSGTSATYAQSAQSYEAFQEKFVLYCDYFSDSTYTVSNGWYVSGNSGTISSDVTAADNLAAIGNRVGVSTITSGAGSQTGYYFVTSALDLSMGPSVALTIKASIYLNAASAANLRLRFGNGVSSNTADSTNQIACEITGRTFQGRCKNGGSATATSNTYTMASSTWYTIGLTISGGGTLVTFFVLDGTSGASLFSGTVSTNIPSATIRPVFSVANDSGGGITKLITLDSLYYERTIMGRA